MSPGCSEEERRRRIKRLIHLARRVADPADALGIEARARLRGTSGLSREGIELALTRHLEANPSEDEIASLLRSTEPSIEASPPRCHVVIAANVCTSALRSIAVAVATSPTVLVRPSSRDPVLADILVRELAEDDAFSEAGGSIALTHGINAAPSDELHIYGSDETITALRAASPPGVVIRGHGTGFGVALIEEGADLPVAAAALASDVIPFDQRGCLSPRIALVGGAPGRAVALFNALDGELRCSKIPRGSFDEEARAELAMYRATVEALGTFREGPSHAVGLDPAPASLLLPPAARVVHVVPASAETALRLLAPWSTYIAAVGAFGEGSLLTALLALAPRARRSNLGEMQRPPLDGPVDRRSGPRGSDRVTFA